MGALWRVVFMLLYLCVCLYAVKLHVEEFQGCFHKSCGDGAFLIPVEIVHAVGRNEPLRLIPGTQLQKFGVGYVGVAGAVGAEARAGQLVAGA